MSDVAVDGEKSTREEFFSRIAHALKGPLQSTLGFAELLGMGRYGELTEEQTKIVFRIGDRSEEVAGLIDGVVEFISLEIGGDEESGERVRPEPLVDAAVARQRKEAEGRGISFTREDSDGGDLRPNRGWVRGDAGLLERLFQTVVRHVTESMDEGTVVIQAGARESETDERRFLFTVAGSTTASPTADAGAGEEAGDGQEPPALLIARFIAESHGGELRTSEASEDGGGRVSVALPLTED